MSTYEDILDDARRERAESRYEAIRPETCACGSDDWHLLGVDPAYGADADGRRGVMLREWECDGCGNVAQVTY